jgi:glycolate oxidase iron-sulfur subunit
MRIRDFALDRIPSRRFAAALATGLTLYARSGLRRLVRRRGWLRRLPAPLQALEALAPEAPERSAPRLPLDVAGSGTARPRVALFKGCIGDALFPDVNAHAAALLELHGYEVIVPPEQTCCGALDLHAGRSGRALARARRNLDAFEAVGLGEPGGTHFVASTAAGCGAMLRDLSRHFGDAPGVTAQARRFELRVRDVTELLVARAPRAVPRPLPIVATYHPPCHLHHAQRVTEAPLALLRSIPGLTLVPLPRAELCCGSAGIYNVLRPAMAGRVRDDKLDAIEATGAGWLVTGNPGCHLHLVAGLAERGRTVRVIHPVSLLAIAHGLAPSESTT